MKNKSLIFFFIIFIFSVLSWNLFANEITFDATEINISENGDVINAINGTAITADKKIKINAKKFLYNKKKFTLDASDDVSFNDFKEKILISSDNISYNIIDEVISSTKTSIITDAFGNTILVENFIYTLKNEFIKLGKTKITDIENNNYLIDSAIIDLKSNKLSGKDITINFDNGSFDVDNEPRLKGVSIIADGNKSIITDGVFTTCKRNDSCPPWELTARKIEHNKKKKIIYYKNAWLKVYDTPVLYFPKFFHPDPTVKRQSGFLMPSFQSSSSLGTSFNSPYFYALDTNKDLTIKPRFFSSNKLLIQTEYREINKNSLKFFDFSFFEKKGESLKGHLFSNFKKEINFLNFDESNLNFNFQHTSNDTYLKSNKVESPLISNQNLMHSYFEINSYKNNLSLNTSIHVYEDLTKLNKSDRYEYIYPDYNLLKEFDNDNNLNGKFSLNSYGYIKEFDTNINEKTIINDFVFNSNLKVLNQGFTSNYTYLLKNSNTDTTNSPSYKENLDNRLDGIFNLKTSLPLIKESEEYISTLNPTMSFRYSPNNTKNMSNNDARIDINNIFSLNRFNSATSVEGGKSLTYGIEYTKADKSNNEIIGVALANIFRPSANKKLPIKGSMNEKTSDIVGQLNLNPNEYLNMSYNFSLNNNLSDKSYETLNSGIKINNFVSTFEYLNENDSSNNLNKSYLTNTTKISNDNNSKSLSFSTRENKSTNATEFYNLLYQYRNDCLIAGLEYNKEYYSDGTIKPEESIFFKLTIVPFGQTTTPNLKK